jgi:hypothetical protein
VHRQRTLSCAQNPLSMSAEYKDADFDVLRHKLQNAVEHFTATQWISLLLRQYDLSDDSFIVLVPCYASTL